MASLASWGQSSVLSVDRTPTSQALVRCEELLAECHGHPGGAARVTMDRAVLTAMRGAFSDARALLAESEAVLEELGATNDAAAVTQRAVMVEKLAGDAVAAEGKARAAFEALLAGGEHGDILAHLAAALAEALCSQGRDQEVLEMSDLSEEIGDSGDPQEGALLLGARATVLARRGDATEAVRLAQEAVELLGSTELFVLHADALLKLAGVLAMVGRTDDAFPVFTEAIAAYDTKENLVMSERARAQLSDLRG